MLQLSRNKMILPIPLTELLIKETDVEGRIHKVWKLFVKEAKEGSEMTGIQKAWKNNTINTASEGGTSGSPCYNGGNVV